MLSRKKFLSMLFGALLALWVLFGSANNVHATSVTQSFHGSSVTAVLNRGTTSATGGTVSGMTPAFYSVDVLLEYYNDYGSYYETHTAKNGNGGDISTYATATGTGPNVHSYNSTSDHALTSFVYYDTWIMHLID